MTIPTATEILDQLKRAKPRPTSEAPRDVRGIYGLFDHTGTFRYIGSTSSVAETFYKRIHQRHRTGSESTSHYFSRMYNTGRMWRLRNDPATKSDGDIAKGQRNAFIARHCGCTWVVLPDDADISGLEAEVIALAPSDMVAWNCRGMDVYHEPVEKVNALIDALDGMLEGCTVYQHSGFDRSAIRAACDSLGRVEPQWTWQNSVSTARAAWPERKGHGGHGLPLKQKPQTGYAGDDVLDDGDTAPVKFAGSVVRPAAHAAAAPTSRVRTPTSSGPYVERHVEKSAIRIPVAADGTSFNTGPGPLVPRREATRSYGAIHPKSRIAP